MLIHWKYHAIDIDRGYVYARRYLSSGELDHTVVVLGRRARGVETGDDVVYYRGYVREVSRVARELRGARSQKRENRP